MSLQNRYEKMLKILDSERLNTWFEIGLFMDRIRDSQNERHIPLELSFDDFKKNVSHGIGFITFYYWIDGVSVEVAKYARAFEKLPGMSDAKIHLIAGKYLNGYETIMNPRWKTFKLDGSNGFDAWDGYSHYFETKLSRGSKEYNELIKKLIAQTKSLTERLGKYIADNDINLLFPVNISSNPGNVSLAFAIAIISEFMDIPILNTNHDF